ncbi:multicopper oxidase family protein [Pseudonocardia spirodelae]|uniref:Copper-containing nitrite reductase n=1 Tax=Pseudonocardia spirodelae TaxID=3133431 RepID=A0ABU8T4K4_9PSEU
MRGARRTAGRRPGDDRRTGRRAGRLNPVAARWRPAVALLATLALLGPVGWLWWSSLLPTPYAVTDMGHVDDGGVPLPGPAGHHAGAAAHGGHGGQAVGGRTVGVDTLRETSTAPPAVSLTLTARRDRIALPTGRVLDGYTLNGTSPGPLIRVRQGDVLQVRLVNADVAEGVTLHWHGVDVPNGDDGTAGVTQDAVPPGGEFVYRFLARDAGTYWYHSHQVADSQVQRGLYGALVVEPRDGPPVRDVVATAHLYDGARLLDGRSPTLAVPAAPGERVRVRVVNTDNGPTSAWVTGAPFRLVAIDGTDVHGPSPVEGRSVPVTAGGRADLEVTVPPGGARVEIGGNAAVVLGAGPGPPPSPRPEQALDPLGYGTPAPLGFDPAAAARTFGYAIGRRPGFLDGVPGLWWTVNGRMWPDVPMFMVAEGEVVRMRISNDSGEVHPMHLHGHHAVVLSRDGVPSTGSPWWVDSLDVADGESYEVALLADNPGVWMDHCHNLTHPSEGLVAHLMYAGVSTPYRVGGPVGNDPE